MVESVALPYWQNLSQWTIVCDDHCPVVRRLARMIKRRDRHNTFIFVGHDSQNAGAQQKQLLKLLDETHWSLILLDDIGNSWAGPEAIPFILKNLPGGKLAAVTYTIPGTMWLTRQLYYLVSRNRHLFASRRYARLRTAGTAPPPE